MSASPNPAIVIAAHNRPASLARLLRSVQAADIAAGTQLTVSIDGGASHHAEVQAVAEQFEWQRGPLSIVEHDAIGLVEHFHRCGDLTEQFGAVVLLEDDLVVGPAFHRWASAALAFASTNDQIAGVSLATPFFDGYRHVPFEPVLDGSDGLFAQVPWYDGMAWTVDMWTRYRSTKPDPTTPVHASLDTLGDDEWFPRAMRYLVKTGRYYLLPRHAQVTNSGAPGAHFATATNYFQVPLTMRGPDHWRLNSLDDSLAVYDDHLELTPHALSRLAPTLAQHDLTVDLLGVRDLAGVTTEHVLTTRLVRRPIQSWGASMHPLVANVVHDATGDHIHLARRDDVVATPASDAVAAATLERHANRGRDASTRKATELALRTAGSALRERATDFVGRVRNDR